MAEHAAINPKTDSSDETNTRAEVRAKAISVAAEVLRTNAEARREALKKLGADDETVGMIQAIDQMIVTIRAKGDVVPDSWGLGCGGIAC
ncbi:hypothetical protein AB4Z51_43930 [Bradyrhizobium sp. 2TAF36]|uniref:hypothetical protein n=1 Tax=Bradyrhizobium sp. 2TAF36 TaxID=3233016 RepID=UPI003F901EAF